MSEIQYSLKNLGNHYPSASYLDLESRSGSYFITEPEAEVTRVYSKGTAPLRVSAEHLTVTYEHVRALTPNK